MKENYLKSQPDNTLNDFFCRVKLDNMLFLTVFIGLIGNQIFNFRRMS